MCRTPLLPLYASALGAGPSLVGLVMGASTVTGVFVKLPAGALSDVLGRRPLLLAAALVFAALPFGYLGVSTVAGLILLRAAHGSATAIFSPVASATVSDMAPASRRAAWLSTYSVAQGAGQALGPVVAGYAIAAGRFDLAFSVAGAIGLAVPLVVWRLRGAAPAAPADARRRQFARGVADVVRDRRVLAASGAQAAQFLLHGSLSAFLPLYARDAIGLEPSEVGWLFALQVLTTLAVRPLMGIVSDRAGRRGLIVAGLLVCGGAVLLVARAGGAASLAAAVAAYAAGAATTSAAASAFVTDVTRRARYGSAHGVFGTIYDVGDALGPLACGVLIARLGYARTFEAMAGVALVAAIVFVIATRPTEAGASRRDAGPGPAGAGRR
jgi:MFS family permease